MDDFLHFFLESSNIEREPADTLLSRLLSLRILYSIRKVDVKNVVETLEDSGVFIGKFDAEQIAHVHDRQKLTQMDPASWDVILKCVKVNSLRAITDQLQADYSDNISQSPFMNLRKIVEEACPNHVAVWDIFVQIFLAYHSKEVRRDELIASILQREINTSLARDLVICILGQHDEDTPATNLQHDICVVMRNVTVDADGVIKNLLCEQEPRDNMMTVRGDLVQNQQSRFSLTRLRENVLRSENIGDKISKSWKPQGIPYVDDLWDTLSSAQQQIVLYITSLQNLKHIDRDKLVAVINPKHNKARASFKHCAIDQSESEQAVAVITSLLLRISLTVDPSKGMLMSLVHEFVETCFQKSLGQVQRNLMSQTLKTQIFLLGYLSKKIRKGVYFQVISAFNDRAFSKQRELALPDSMNTHVQDCMQEWVSAREFPEEFMHEIFKPLCV